MKQRLAIFGTASALALLSTGCGSESSNPSSATTINITVTAPGIVSPTNGAQVQGNATLTVTNASVSGSTGSPTYTFEVATDSGFASIVAQASAIAQGSGQTTWMAGSDLPSGTLFWRARAVVGSTQGPFSAVAEFEYTSVPGTAGANDQILLFDSLTNGSTVGDVGGGQFTSEGWLVEASSNFIVYDMPTIEKGFLEFDVKGLDIRNPTRDARHLFFMWDPSLGSDMTENRFRVSLQKLDGRSSINDRWLRLRWISQGRQLDFGSTFRGWETERTYRIRLEWGREGDVNACRLFINGNQIFFFQYPRPYIPQIHRIELGAAQRAETPEGAIYSNVTIGRR